MTRPVKTAAAAADPCPVSTTHHQVALMFAYTSPADVTTVRVSAVFPSPAQVEVWVERETCCHCEQRMLDVFGNW